MASALVCLETFVGTTSSPTVGRLATTYGATATSLTKVYSTEKEKGSVLIGVCCIMVRATKEALFWDGP